MSNVFNVWEFPKDTQLERAGAVAQRRLRPAQLAVRVRESEGDVLRLKVTLGRIRDPGGLFYVERHGLFVMEARERDRGDRTLLTLRAWPSV